ncbi:MAG: metallophosphoesterase [Bdellovibrionales bacterium]
MAEIFRKADFTAIISDLHLTEEEPVHPKYPLWKKYKTREFFYDEELCEFFKLIEEKAERAKVELILNGDIFDFDSVVTVPQQPNFRVSWLEKKRGLEPKSEKSRYKISKILSDHQVFVQGLAKFIRDGNRVVFVIGNHDLELHYSEVQEEILKTLNLTAYERERVLFVDWFYISNGDTLVEHGNQYDPYCLCEDPVNPFIKGYNHISLKLPFGNLACRYIMNGLGFFNPHTDGGYIMTLKDYISIFLRFMARAQPLLVFTWFGGALLTLWDTLKGRITPPLRNAFTIEKRVEQMAEKANAEPHMVREMKELIVAPAASNPFLIARELWLDRAFFILIGSVIIFYIFTFLKALFGISLFWSFIPMMLLLPFFLFYSRSITSLVSSYKEPDDRILAMTAIITKTKRVVYGHTHQPRHEIIGAVEHLNSGTWSPAFADVEYKKPMEQRNFVWISPFEGSRRAELLKFERNLKAQRDNEAS